MTTLKLCLLGSPHLTVNDNAVTIGRQKALALFCYLAVKGEPQRRDLLATLLWPDAGQSQARAALSRHLTEVRGLIGGTAITADRETVSLAGELWLDVAHFQRQVTDIDLAAPDALDRLNQAVALYRDDFMSGFNLPDCPAFDEWQFYQSERLRQQFATALTHLVTIHCEQHDFAAALAQALRLLTLDTLHEATHRQVMELYARSGQVRAALRQFELCVQMMDEEFGAPPAAETVALYERIRGGELSREFAQPLSAAIPTKHPAKKRHNLPAQSTPFVGREAEMAAVTKLLMNTAGRLVTIVGPGGMGKTRLALAIAEAQVATGYFAHGVYFVALAPLSEVEHIATAIAEALGFRIESEGQRHEPAHVQLLNHLREQQLLLVLDNFEHLLAGGDLVAELLQRAPGVRILATSRERLHLQGEQLFPIHGLDFPNGEQPADATTYTAIQLFIQSARRIRPDFALAASDLSHLTRICRLVEGMPLGIELAAGWVDLLSLAEIAAEIQRSIDILETEVRDLPERHRSMRAVFDSSWQRLQAAERQIFSSFAVFRGGFTRQAAESVAGASLRLLSRLVSQSLLHYEERTGRYQIHELLGQYAAEKLADSGQMATIRAAHAAYFAQLMQQQERGLKGREQRQAKAAIAADFENVRQGWLWAVERRDAAILAQSGEALYWFCENDAQRYRAGQDLFQQAREALAPAADEAPQPVWGKLLARILPYGVSEFEQPLQAQAWLSQALAIAQAHGDEAEQAYCCWRLGSVHTNLGEFAQATVELEQSLAYYRRIGDLFYTAQVLHALGEVYNRLRQPQRGIDYLQQAIELHRALGISAFPIATLVGLSLAANDEIAAGEALLWEAYQNSQAEGNPSDMAGGLVYLSRVLSKKGDFAAAQSAAQEALAIAQAHNLGYRQQQAKMDVGMRAHERGELAQAFSQLRQVQDRATVFRDQVRIEVILALTLDELGQKDQTLSYLVERLQGPIDLALYSLPLAVLYFKRTGEVERAVTLLALFTMHDKFSHLAWLDANRSYMQHLREDLRTAVAPDRFAAAWMRGKALDPATTLSALAEELALVP
ncbi:MAG TPA: BTAD domain-containing putative transcriptional regulator [Caldilineaceae bacterium]|mgnify:CR=1 FL=1|nr:BTAD domain-containing putative transcriptional regulator [Caldilineaceae bacterium]